MKRKILLFTMSLLVVVIIVVLFFAISTRILSVFQSENTKYTMIEKSMPVVGIVTESHENKGVALVTINDSLKVWFIESRNYEYNSPYLYSFINIGDSIVKDRNHDTLFIYRGSDHYYFVIGEFINQKK